MSTHEILKIVSILVALGVFLSFFWSIKKFFKTPDGVPTRMKVISNLGTVFVLIHLACLSLFESSVPLRMIGILIYLVALSVFILALRANWQKPLSLAYSKDSPQHLVQSGIYQKIRHPFYTSYTLAWIAGVVASHQLLLSITVMVMFYLYFQSAKLEEEKFLNSEYRKAYEEYQKNSGMFTPFV